MDFKLFKELLQRHVATDLMEQNTLFITDIDKDALWDLYLSSFPEGTNEIFRKRKEYDCSCCRHFIKSFGNVVTIKDNKVTSIWDFITNDSTYQPVIDSLSAYVKSKPIKDVFITKEKTFGTNKSHERLEDGTVRTWNHFSITLPNHFISTSSKSVGDLTGSFRDNRNVFKRSLTEISKDSIETVIELIAQKSLYKGEEWEGALKLLLDTHKEFNSALENEKELFCWEKASYTSAAVTKIKNHAIGVLLTDISKGVELNAAVKRYETIVAPYNYKRPKTIFTAKMVEQAEEKLVELGMLNSLARRHATIEDITVNNILFANKDTMKKLADGVNIFSDLKKEIPVNIKKFDKIEEISIEQFVKEILPKISNIEVLFENKHFSNLMSVIAPEHKSSKTMFKWNNNFSWAYSGNITDSVKERVKKAGGNVNGVLRFSIQWNEDGNNNNDFDAYCLEPNGNYIFYSRPKNINTTGRLDVDIQRPEKEIAVENITWTNKSLMQEGIYDFFVHNFNHRGGKTGFKAEIEYENQIYSYIYNKELMCKKKVQVAKISFSKKDGIKFLSSLPLTETSKTIWNLNTNQFHTVSICMLSPNYWNKQSGIGNKHYFFILKNCQNNESPNGFFNEFLKEDLLQYKHVFAALGNKMKVADSENQLSGIGFSSTQRNSLTCRLTGTFNRIIKLIF
jgi:hypothetical protein